MSTTLFHLLLSGLTLFGLPTNAVPTQQFRVNSFKVNLSDRVPHMLDLIRNTQLPSYELAAARESTNDTLSTGISLQTLKDLQKEWITDFKWDEEQASINEYGEFLSPSFDDSEAYFVAGYITSPSKLKV